MNSQISFAQAQSLVLARLEQDKSQLPRSEWDKKRYIIGPWVKLSINELIDAVKRGTPIGKTYIIENATSLGYTVVG